MSFKSREAGPAFSGGNFFRASAAPGSSVRLPLSESPHGLLIGPIGTGWTKIHEADESAMDEVYLWACNYSDSNIELTISVGYASTVAGDYIEHPVTAADGFTLVFPGLPIKNKISIYAKGSAGSITVGGFAMRHNPVNPADLEAGYGAGGGGN